MRVTYIIACAGVAASLLAAAPATAQNAYSIAAIVNEDVISTLDVQARVRLVMSVSNTENTEENRRRMLPVAMRSLIDERLQMQEAARLNVTTTNQELKEAIAVITRQNRLPPGGLEERLRAEGIPMATLEAQLRATLAWGKVIRRQIRPQVEITDEEVDEFLDQLRARGGAAEYDVSEILIPIDTAGDEGGAAQTAQRVVQQARRGTPFASLARQFSQSSSAAEGGDLGRVQEGQLDRRLETALRDLQPGEVSDPIRVENGFYILQLRDKRQRAAAPAAASAGDTVALRRIFLPVVRGAPAKDVKSQGDLAAQVSETVQGCSDMDRLAKEVKATGAVDIGRLRTADLPQQLREVVEKLPIGKASPPLRNSDGFIVLMVCERGKGGGPAPTQTAAANLPEREEVVRSLGAQRVDMLARRYMRDLRRAAFVDIRT